MVTTPQIEVADKARRSDSMSPRERLRAALTRQRPDRVPVSFRLIDPYNPTEERATTDANYAALREYAQRYTEVMHVWEVDQQQPLFCDAPDVKIRTAESPSGATLTTVSASAGELTEIKRSVGGTNWATKHFIETDDDLDVYLSIDGDPLRPDLGSFFRETERLGCGGLMRISLSDPIGMLAPLLPRETLYTWMLERPELVDALQERMFDRLAGLVTYLAESRVECVFQFSGAEYAAPPMASPALFDRYVGRFGPPITEVLHANGCLPILHCHSRVGALLDRFVEMGYLATHPVEPPPMGDVTPAQFRGRVGQRLAMIGNVQIGEMLTGEPDTVRAWVRGLIETMGVAGGLVVSESASPWERPMKDVTLRNYLTVIEAVHEHGRGH